MQVELHADKGILNNITVHTVPDEFRIDIFKQCQIRYIVLNNAYTEFCSSYEHVEMKARRCHNNACKTVPHENILIVAIKC